MCVFGGAQGRAQDDRAMVLRHRNPPQNEPMPCRPVPLLVQLRLGKASFFQTNISNCSPSGRISRGVASMFGDFTPLGNQILIEWNP